MSDNLARNKLKKEGVDRRPSTACTVVEQKAGPVLGMTAAGRGKGKDIAGANANG